MKVYKLTLYFSFLFLNFYIYSLETSPAKVKALYSSLDPLSLAEHLAFYHLYENYPEGKRALSDAYRLLTGEKEPQNHEYLTALPSLTAAIDTLIKLISKSADAISCELNDAELTFIEKLSERLPNRKIKGYWAQKEAEVLELPPEDIDLAHGILLTQLENDDQAFKKIRSYEAMIDLMALQILARIPLTASPQAKIHAMNHFIFEEMGFRFPPHSLYAKDIDVYTFLPSVLDTRRGVCLGVSILYISLAQRLNLNLEMITPPGHIYVRYRNGEQVINIETTARGIHLDSEEYLGIDTSALQQRNIKEVIGLAYFNQASIYWEQKNYKNALQCYLKACNYMPNDKLLQELMGYAYILNGDQAAGEESLRKLVEGPLENSVVRETLALDYLQGTIDAEGIEAMFLNVEDKRDAIIQKRKLLEAILEKHPKFRAGLFSLAGLWIQLHREKEALTALVRYHEIDPNNPQVEYYLAVIYASRYDYNNAWKHLKKTEEIVNSRNYSPKDLENLRKELATKYPE